MIHTRLIDTGNLRLSGKANTISAQLQAIAARATGRVPFINQEEANLTQAHSPVSQFKGGDCPSSSPADFQDIDASRDDYRAGISKGVNV